MKFYSHDANFDTKDLIKPSPRQRSLLSKIKKEMGFTKKRVRFYIHPCIRNSNNTFTQKGTVNFSGMACYNKSIYAIIISSYVFKGGLPYIKYVLKHELKHCLPTVKGKPFRYHDQSLLDEGWNDNRMSYIGFFKEEWDVIGCCDDLMAYFRNCKDIESYI